MKISITTAIFNSDGNFPFKIAVLILLIKGIHIYFASERKTFVGIVPLVDSFWFTLRLALYISKGRTWRKLKRFLLVWKISPFCGFYFRALSVYVMLIKYWLKTFTTLCFSDMERFLSINVIFWSYCKPFSVKKRLQSFQRFLFFILSLVESGSTIGWRYNFCGSFPLLFYIVWELDLVVIYNAFRSSCFPLSCALFLSFDLVMVFSNRRCYVTFIISSNYAFFKRSYCI